MNIRPVALALVAVGTALWSMGEDSMKLSRALAFLSGMYATRAVFAIMHPEPEKA